MSQDKRSKPADNSTPPGAPAPARVVLWPVVVAVVAIFVFAKAGFLQPAGGSLATEIAAVKADQQTILRDIQELKQLLGSRPAAAAPSAPSAPGAQPTVAVAGSPFKGNANAKVTLVEFSDYQCPFCARHVQQTIPQLEREYIQSGRLKYVFRNFPLESIHKQAAKAAEAAECAGDQNKFWPIHDRIFAGQTRLSPADLVVHAREEGLNMSQFQQCLDSGRHAKRLGQDLADAQAAGVSGTPAFFLGVTTPGNGPIKAVKTIRGAKPYAEFKAAIDELLGQQGANTTS